MICVTELSTSTGPLLLKIKTLTETVAKLQSQLNGPSAAAHLLAFNNLNSSIFF